MNAADPASTNQPFIGALVVLASLVSQNIGAAFAKMLFPLVGPAGMTSLRIGLAACLLVLIRRAWKSMPERGFYRDVIRYGAMLGLMNLLIYQSFARIPIGIAVAIEILGPLSVVLMGTKKRWDLVWLAAAVGGLVLLLPLDATASTLDPIGVICAMGAAISWAIYILAGKKLAATPNVDAVAWGMVVAAVITLPFGIAGSGSSLLSMHVILIGLVVAALSSALPYSLEMVALRRMAAPLFSIVISTAPAVAAMAGFFILNEELALLQWLAIALIMLAAAGSTLSTYSGSRN